jgi:cytochrome c551/c552
VKRKFVPVVIQTAVLVLLALPHLKQMSAMPDTHIDLFQTSDRCMACHNGLSTSTGEDISIGLSWRATMMANSARDPYWQAGVRREVLDHPESKAAIEDECATCHMPMARYQSKYEGKEAEVFARLTFGSDDRMDRLAQDGVSCSLCHQITSEKLGTRESLVGGFVVDTTKQRGERAEYGQYKIEDGQARIMRSSSAGYKPTQGEHIQKSELCATCHTLITKALGPGGKVIGQLPEQMPYQEWLASEFREKQSCQSCHMPEVGEETRIAVTLGMPREKMGRHVFIGGNFFMLRMLNRYRSELGVAALPLEFEAAATRTIEHLKAETAKLAIDQAVLFGDGRLQVDLSIENRSGHKFPTAYPSRRAWLHVSVKDRNNRVIFESGAINPNGSIQGNDNDADPVRFEPHYSEITNPEQVQIYEDIMVGTNNVPTTGLLTAVRFIKDNRLLPRGFNKASVDQEIAPQGEATMDANFIGGSDKIRYVVATNGPGPYQFDAELWFQPISYRWANNLKSYNAMETQRFTRYYETMSSGSGLLLDRVSVRR